MSFIIKNKDKTLGVARFVDDAKDFAERLSGRPSGTSWNPYGMLLIGGVPSGWQVLKFNPESE